MLEFARDVQETIPVSQVKIVGLGGAGANMLDRLVLDGLEGVELLALNTDLRTLAGAVAAEKIQLGRNLTKGLGAGGDPELGHQAAVEAEREIRGALKGRKIVFICCGLGGGTGSGAAPLVARIAREEGAFVVVFACMPFSFEGRRRRDQAQTALNELAVLSNALVTFENGRMGELVLAKQGVHEAFVAADRMIADSIKAVTRLVSKPGLIHVGLDELMTALRTTRSRCLFGSATASGKDRATKALRAALASPLLDQGALLKQAQTVLVHLCGGEDLTLFEIELLMQALEKQIPADAHLLFGAAVDPTMGDALSVTLISSLPEEKLAGEKEEVPAPKAVEAPKPVEVPAPVVEEPKVSPPIMAEVITMEFPKVEAPVIVAKETELPPVTPESAVVETKSLFEAVIPEPEIKTSEVPAPMAVEEVSLPPLEVKELQETPEIEEKEEAIAKDEEQPPVEALDEIPAVESRLNFGSASQEKEDLPATKPEVVPPRVIPSAPAPIKDKLEDDEIPEEIREAVERELDPKPIAQRPKLAKATAQPELSFDGGPRGRFQGEEPNIFEGEEDLDVPSFLRKKKV